MNFTKKKMDRAFQWAGEKMGHDARTNQTDEFKSLETEIALRHDGKGSNSKFVLNWKCTCSLTKAASNRHGAYAQVYERLHEIDFEAVRGPR